MKIAITTTDGISVDEHFGKATQFYIYNIENEILNFIEVRKVQSYCECEAGEPINPNHQFSLDRFQIVYNEIKDCDILYTKQIGDIPLKNLKKNGMIIKTCSCEIKLISGCEGNCKH